MFEKIISKNTEAATTDTPSAPRAEHAPPASTDPNRLVAISAGKRNVLGSDVEIEGEVRFQNDLIVDGRIEGRIVSEGSLTIGETAHIKAEIKCGSVIVQGRLEGNITATGRVEICALAEVTGDIKAEALSMEAGAVFVGASAIGTPRNRPKVVAKPPELKEQAAGGTAKSEKAPAA